MNGLRKVDIRAGDHALDCKANLVVLNILVFQRTDTRLLRSPHIV